MPAVGIDINLFWQIINFIILIFVFKRFFHKPLNEFLETRREKIAGELTQAKKDREVAVTLNEEAVKMKKEAKLEANKIISAAEKKAEERKELILKETHALRGKMISSAEADIAKMQSQARKELQVEATKLAATLAEKMIQEKMSKELGENLLDQFIDEVGDSK
jgi:F-type H+-transporting ATPase subunit b